VRRFLPAAIAAIGLAGTLVAGCDRRPPVPPPPKNVIVINVDTLRADHLGCYGYLRDTSPFIDSLAAAGVRFDEARVNSTFTRESVAALMTGRLPSRSGSMGWDATPPPGDATLGRIFERAGYATGFFSATTMLTDPGFTQGFQTVRQLTERWGASGLGPELSAAALAFARAPRDRPFLMYVHYLDPHGPYDPTPAHLRKFAPAPLPSPLGLYADVRSRLAELVAEGFGPGEARFDDMVARYDAEIADTDVAIAELFAGLDGQGLLDRTIVVLTADHGEELLDHGFVEHAWTLYEEVLRVPLVFWPATVLPGLDGRRRAATVDVLPTLLALVGIAAPAGLDGRSLLTKGDAPLVAELAIAERSVLRTVIDGRWKYVAAAKWLPPPARSAAARVENDLRRQGGERGVDRCGPTVHEELYDLVADPSEHHNRVADDAGHLEALRAALAPTLEACRAHAAALKDGPSAADRARLRALGYVE
jgi:arylsulfatase